MSKKRRKFSSEFKTCVALDALSGEHTIAELSSKYGGHPNQISQWKKQAKEGMAASFSGKIQNDQQTNEAHIKELHAKIGKSDHRKRFFTKSLCQNMSAAGRRGIIDTGHPQLSICNQCKLLDLQRSSYYYQPQVASEYNLELISVIDELFTNLPFLGSRQMRRMLFDTGHHVGRSRVHRLIRKIGLKAVFHKPRTSEPHPEHMIYPYLLRKVPIVRPNQVWCADITYIPMKKGFLYLVTVMDWYSRAVFSWRLSNTMDSDFCLAPLEDALNRYGFPEIFNTDQGAQFTSYAFTKTLRDSGVRISIDSRGPWLDNAMIERLWRSLKYECVYLREYETGSDLRQTLAWWFDFYNSRRTHSVFNGRKPMEIYQNELPEWVPPLAGLKKAA